MLKNLVTLANGDDYDLVVNLGDLIQYENSIIDLENFKVIWQEHKNFNAKVFAVTGNHDHINLSISQIKEVLGYENLTYSINYNGYHLIFLGIDINEGIDNAKGGILKSYTLSDKTLKWLREDLKNNKLPCLVFSHYGVANVSMKNNYWFGKDDRSAELHSIIIKTKYLTF